MKKKSKARIKQTGEVFTPPELVERLLDQIPEEKFQNPGSTFLDNAAGDGNFMVALKERLLRYGHSEQHILDNMLYAVEYMPDNHRRLCERIGVSPTHPHYVRADATQYDYSFGTIDPLGPVTLDDFFE